MPPNDLANTTASATEYQQLRLACLFCGGEAILRGRWHNATVLCTVCGMKSSAKLYREQIEQWQENVCRCLVQGRTP